MTSNVKILTRSQENAQAASSLQGPQHQSQQPLFTQESPQEFPTGQHMPLIISQQEPDVTLVALNFFEKALLVEPSE
eukprot:CAMPEP_0175099400 /NCGR_PEP_ID=MMETSP0086_2-20121207/6437_1 /TAXON_ID=136419 /ORGANISM="Unknown Unknown, Strain D1" /LENGTH=76 /DNA_ID=CAMNT_0016373249 /DNA_START=495 /DNA_END=725 /DNA_ORIENTATION=-